MGPGERLVNLQFSTTPSAMQLSEVRLLLVLQDGVHDFKIKGLFISLTTYNIINLESIINKIKKQKQTSCQIHFNECLHF